MPIKIDIQLEVQDITSTSAMIKWRFFASHEKQYIDGAQIRYHSFITILRSYEEHYITIGEKHAKACVITTVLIFFIGM